MRQLKRILTLVSFIQFLVIVLAGPLAAEKKNIAVLDFSANNISSPEGDILRNRIEVLLYSSGKIRVLERQKYRQKVIEQNIDTFSCTDTACAARVGRYIFADYVVMGSVDRLSGYSLHIRVVESETGFIVFAGTENVSQRDDLYNALYSLTESLLESLDKKDEEKANASPETGISPLLSFSLGYSLPIYSLRDRADYGTSFLVSLLYSVYGFSFGLRSGFTGLMDSSGNLYAYVLPVLAGCQYRVSLGRAGIIPSLSLGMVYSRIQSEGSGILEPAVQTGLGFSYMIRSHVSLGVAVDYNYIIEKSGGIQFFTFGAGTAIYF